MVSWKYAALTEKMNPIDDEFFRKMAEDIEFCEEILRVILADCRLRIQSVIPQNSIKNLQGRSVVLDALCMTKEGRYCHIEGRR